MFEIIPSPGTQEKEWAAIAKRIDSIKPFVNTLHVDVCDGKFAPNVTFSDPTPFAAYAKVFTLEVHLMVEEPVTYLKKWADAGFRRFIGQIEKMSDQAEFVAEAQLLGEVGLAVDGPTPYDAIKISPEDLDCLLFFTGEKAGFSGQSFLPDRLDKIKTAREKMPYLPIEIDGGVNEETIQMAYMAGVTRFVVTSFLFAMETPEKQYTLLQEKLENLPKL